MYYHHHNFLSIIKLLFDYLLLFLLFPARLFDYIDTGVMEGLQHRLLELAKTRTQGQLAETPGDSMALTSQVSLKLLIGEIFIFKA